MKSACRAAAFGAALAIAVLPTRGDNAPSVSLAPAPPSAPQIPPGLSLAPVIPDADSLSAGDPDVVVQQSEKAREDFQRQNQNDYDEAVQKQQAYDADWMLRDYNARLKAEGLANSADRAAAKSEEVPDPSAPLAAQLDPLLPPPADSKGPPPPPPHPDDNTDVSEAPAPDLPTPFLKPLLPPLTDPGSSPTTTRLNAWGSDTVSTPSTPDGSNPTMLPPGTHDLRSADTTSTESELDVPGLTAERQGLGDTGDLNLPDQQMEAATENADNRARKDFLLPTVATNDSTDFFRRQSEALAPPNSNSALHPPVAGNIPLGRPLPPPAAPKVAPTTGIRSHVDDPFDIIGGHRDPDAARDW